MPSHLSQKTIWFDDEGADPGKGFATFVRANASNVPQLFESEYRRGRLAFCVNYWNDRTGGKLVSLQYVDEGERIPAEFVRYVTRDELRQINAVVKFAAADYHKRLEAYYKKYADKVMSCGYWVNR